MDLNIDLKVDLVEVGKYLGYRDAEIDAETKVLIEKAVAELKAVALAKCCYKKFGLEAYEDELYLGDSDFSLAGADIKNLLGECEQCLLLAVTLGAGVDGLIRKSQIVDMAYAVVVDACASSMVEELCNDFESQLKGSSSFCDLYFTDRFSPGYGDMPLECQKSFCLVLDTAKNIGLNVAHSGIMMPAKSITAVVGIAKNPQKMKLKGCEYCSFHGDCQYSKIGKRCE